MPKNSNEYDRQQRFLRKKVQAEQTVILLKILEELENLRKEVAILAQETLTSPIKKILSSSSESMSLKKKDSRESEQARLDRLRSWMPSSEEEERAFNKGYDQAYVSQQADLYRCRQENAKGNAKHTNFDAGFKAWMIRAPTFEGNGNGHTNGRSEKLSPVGKLWLGASQVVEEIERRQLVSRRDEEDERNSRSNSLNVSPLLDLRRRSN